MTKIKLILLFLSISTFTCFSQSLSRYVISSGGKYASNSNGGLSANLGELAVHTYTTTGNIFTEGFEQPPPFLSTKVQSTEISKNILGIFPNPASDHVVISLGKSSKLAVLEVYDAQGRHIDITSKLQKTADDNYLLNVSFLENGIYLIKIIDPGVNSGYKVIRFVKI